MRVANYVHRLQRETKLCSMLGFADVRVSKKLLEHIHFLHQRKETISYMIAGTSDGAGERERERYDCINRNV